MCIVVIFDEICGIKLDCDDFVVSCIVVVVLVLWYICFEIENFVFWVEFLVWMVDWFVILFGEVFGVGEFEWMCDKVVFE